MVHEGFEHGIKKMCTPLVYTMAELLGFIAVATGVGIYASRSRSRGRSKSESDDSQNSETPPKPASGPTAKQNAKQAKRNEAARLAKVALNQKRVRKQVNAKIKANKARAEQEAKEAAAETFQTPPSTPATSPYVTPSNKTDPRYDTFYNVLGVSKNASQAEIKRAFHKKAMPLHPNRRTNKTNKSAEQEYNKLLRAYKILTDPKERANYDRRRSVRLKNIKRIKNDPERKSTRALETMSNWPMVGSIIEKDPRLRRIIGTVVDSLDATYKRSMLDNLKTAVNRARNERAILTGILYAFAAVASLAMTWYMVVRGAPQAIEWSRDFVYSVRIVAQNTRAQSKVVLTESMRRLTDRYNTVTAVPGNLVRMSKKSLLNAANATRGAIATTTQPTIAVIKNITTTTRSLLGSVAKEVQKDMTETQPGNTVGPWWSYLFSAAVASATVKDLRQRMVPFVLLWLTFMVLLFGVLCNEAVPKGGGQLAWSTSGARPTYQLFNMTLNSTNVPVFRN